MFPRTYKTIVNINGLGDEAGDDNRDNVVALRVSAHGTSPDDLNQTPVSNSNIDGVRNTLFRCDSNTKNTIE